MKNFKLCMLFSVIFLTACSFNTSESTNESNDTKSIQPSPQSYDQSPPKEELSSNNNRKELTHSNQDIAQEIKNYILNDQENKPEAQKTKWSKTFLNEVDIESLYTQYTADKGNADDLESFATYMTLNAPILSNWEDLFKKDLYETYEEKVSRLEHLEDDLYQAYIIKEGTEIPYVVVSSRTGYFHG